MTGVLNSRLPFGNSKTAPSKFGDFRSFFIFTKPGKRQGVTINTKKMPLKVREDTKMNKGV